MERPKAEAPAQELWAYIEHLESEQEAVEAFGQELDIMARDLALYADRLDATNRDSNNAYEQWDPR